MKSSESKSSFRSLLELGITSAIIVTYALLTIVVIMLVTGTLHVLSRNFFQSSMINIISVVIAVIILILSASFFIKAFKSIRSTVIEVMFHNQDHT